MCIDDIYGNDNSNGKKDDDDNNNDDRKQKNDGNNNNENSDCNEILNHTNKVKDKKQMKKKCRKRQ